jgi:hypothetical protein
VQDQHFGRNVGLNQSASHYVHHFILLPLQHTYVNAFACSILKISTLATLSLP